MGRSLYEKHKKNNDALKVIYTGQKGKMWLIFQFKTIFSKTLLINFSLYWHEVSPRRVPMNCKKLYLIDSLKVIFKDLKGQKKVNFGCFATFCRFSQIFYFIFCIQLFGDDIDQLSRDGFD